MNFSIFFSNFLVYLFLLFNKNIFCENQSENIDEVINNWKKFNDNVEIDLDRLTSGFASNFESIAKEANVSSECHESFRKILVDAKLKKAYALKVLGSWGKLPTMEILEGTFTSFGIFDSCMSVDEIETHYCSVELEIYLPKRKPFHSAVVPLKEMTDAFQNQSDYLIGKFAKMAHLNYYGRFAFTGVCLPKVCNENDVNRTMRVVGDRLHLKGKLYECLEKKSKKLDLDVYQICSLLFLSFLILLAVIGSTLDSFKAKLEQNTFCQYLLAFSVKRNFHSLFKINKSVDDLKCLNGLRVLTLWWVIFGHTLDRFNYSAFQSVLNMGEMATSFEIQWIFNMTYSVETFFVISGLLTSYTEIKKRDQNNFNFLKYALSRYLRLIPGLLAAMALMYFPLLAGDGPVFNETMKPHVQACYNYWWTNLLLVHNNLDVKNLCVGPSWWLSVDYQFHLIGFFAISLYFRKSFFSATYIFFIWFISILMIVYTYLNNYLPPDHIPTILIIDEYATKVYVQPFIHIGSYFIGLLLGLLIAKRKSFFNSKLIYIFGWIIALITLFTTLQSTYSWNRGAPWSNFSAIIHACTNRSVWALCVAWIIYACCLGYGGPINAFLCWDGFVILARQSYMTYLFHDMVLLYYMATRKSLINLDSLSIAYIVLSNAMISFMLGFVFTILCEKPFLIVRKLIFEKQKSNEEKFPLDNGTDSLELNNHNNTNGFSKNKLL